MRHTVWLTFLFTVAFLLVRDKIASVPYYYDESDYMFAASLGAQQNWLDVGSMSISDFVRIGRTQGPDPHQQVALSSVARNSRDPVVYRHWHGPLYFYYLAALSGLGLDEQGNRSFSFLFPALTASVMYFGSLLVLGGLEGRIAAMLSSALFLWSPVTLETSELAPHMLFVLSYTCALMLLAKVAAGGGRRYFYAAAICAGLAFSTLEVAFVLIVVLFVMAWLHRATLHAGWGLARNSLGLFLATVLAVWPAGLIKLDFVKAYMVMAYLAVFRKGAWGDVTFAGTWISRFLTSPFEWCLIVLALSLLLFLAPRRVRAEAIPFALFAALMLLATIRVYTDVPRYMTPFLAALQLFTAWMLAPVLARLPRRWLVSAAVAGICGLLIWNSHRRLSGYLLREDPRPATALSALRAHGMAEKTLIAPRLNIPTLHYYFPRMEVRGYSSPEEITAAQSSGHFDAVLYPDYSLEFGAPAGRP